MNFRVPPIGEFEPSHLLPILHIVQIVGLILGAVAVVLILAQLSVRLTSNRKKSPETSTPHTPTAKDADK